MSEASKIVDLILNNGIEMWVEDNRLLVRWTRDGDMPVGAAMFIRRFKLAIIQELRKREIEALTDEGEAA